MILDTVTSDVDVLAARVQDLQEEVDKLPLVDKIKFYHTIKELHGRLDTARKRIFHVQDRYSKGVIPEAMDEMGVDKLQVPELGHSFYPLTKYSAKLVDKERGMAWLRENGAEALIQPTVNASSLAGYLKDMMLNEGIEAPEDVAQLTVYRITGASKYNPK